MKSILSVLFLVVSMHLSYASTDPSVNEQEITCQRLFDELKTARGISLNDKPTLQIVRRLDPNRYKLALADNINGIIQIEKATVRLCFNQLGADSLNALAFILSHELSHYIHQHSMVHKFISNMVDVDTQSRAMVVVNDIPTVEENVNKLDSISDLYKNILVKFKVRQNESQADLDAGFTSYLAGYDTKVAGQKFFDAAYPEFNISDDSGLYPTLAERKEIVRRTGERLDTLTKVFEAANYLSVINEFDYAEMCYDYVSQEFKSKAILNNLGVIQLRKFVTIVDKSLIKYALPITMELQFGDGNRNFESPEERIRILTAEYMERKAILDKAIEYFDRSALLDNGYAVPLLNKSVTYFLASKLKKEYLEFAEFVDDDIQFAKTYCLLARQAQSKKTNQEENQLKGNILGFLAVLHHEMGDDAPSVESLFEEALSISPNNPLIIKNKGIVNNTAELANVSDMDKSHNQCTEEEKIAGQNIDELMELVNSNPDFSVVIKDIGNARGEFVKLKFKDNSTNSSYTIFTHSKLLSELDRKSWAGFAVPKKSITETSCFVELGGSNADIVDFYGEQVEAIETPTGSLTYLINNPRYTDDKMSQEGIIFNVKANSIAGWCLFKKMK